MNKLLLILVSVMLVGCAAKPIIPIATLCPLCMNPGGVAPADLDDAEIIPQHQQTIARLKSNGVQIFQVGDHVTLVIPADVAFINNTPASNPVYYPILNRIALLLRDYEKVSVKVAGYTDNQGCFDRNVALSRARARRITDYLWEQGVDARFMVAVGYGEQDPIASNSTASGRMQNRRIEITLQQLPG
jgi:outer membrane protein OmpA-like peptidoglycan-associated protein